jgi:23S rRNA (pseudouridine1915-N3)-methyltransferase
MYRIKILSIGKTKETWLQSAFDEYAKRLQSVASFDLVWVKDNTQLISTANKESDPIILDPRGKLYTSETFSQMLVDALEKGGSKVTFIIGGAEGLPEEVKRMGRLVGFSPLTFTHQITRLILIEQIYRSLEIARGSQYHK